MSGFGQFLFGASAFGDGGFGEAASPLGYALAAVDGSYGAWLSTNSNGLSYFSALSSTMLFSTTVPLTGSAVIVGLSVTGSAISGNTLIGVGSDGSVFTTNSSQGGTTNFIAPGFVAQTRGAAVGYGNLYAALPSSGALGVMALGSNAFSAISTPAAMPIPSILSVPLTGITGNDIAVAGWALASVASGAVALTASPASPLTLAVFAQPTSVNLLAGNDPVWAIASSVTGLSGCNALAWNPDGSQVFASGASGVTILDLIGGSLSVASAISLTGATSISVSSDSTNALICRPASNAITVLIGALDSWTTGTSTFLSSPAATLLTSATAGWALSSTNLVPLARVGNNWNAGASVPLGFTGKAIAEDSLTGNIFVIGGSGTTGYISLVQNGIAVSTLAYLGSYGTALIVQNGQAAVLCSDGATIKMFGAAGSTLVAQGVNTLSAPTGSTVIAETGVSVWLANALEILECTWSAPYSITQRKSGVFGLHDGASWATYSLGCNADPTAMAWDVSGNTWLATAQNGLYSFAGLAVSGNVSLLSHNSIPPYAGQLSGTTLGISSLVWNGGHLYASTAFSGSLVELM